jgi:hypothetical protein
LKRGFSSWMTVYQCDVNKNPDKTHLRACAICPCNPGLLP